MVATACPLLISLLYGIRCFHSALVSGARMDVAGMGSATRGDEPMLGEEAGTPPLPPPPAESLPQHPRHPLSGHHPGHPPFIPDPDYNSSDDDTPKQGPLTGYDKLANKTLYIIREGMSLSLQFKIRIPSINTTETSTFLGVCSSVRKITVGC